jgi:hypothetical protein
LDHYFARSASARRPASVIFRVRGYTERVVAGTGLFTIKSNTEAVGKESYAAVRSNIECERSCAQSAACKIFSYNKASGACYLYLRADSFKQNRNYESGERK